MSEELKPKMPETDEMPDEGHLNLSRTIQSFEDVEAMDTAELESSLAMHEAEIIRIVGALEVRRGTRPRWEVPARQAERTLRLHKSWIERELKARRYANEKATVAQAKRARAEAHQQALEKARAEKMARISASNDENMRQVAVFKAVAREVLGAEQYLHLWNLVRLRMGAPMPGDEG